jgi:hypothetical protein
MESIFEHIVSIYREVMEYPTHDDKTAMSAATDGRGKAIKLLCEALCSAWDRCVTLQTQIRSKRQSTLKPRRIKKTGRKPTDDQIIINYTVASAERLHRMLHTDYEVPQDPHELMDDLGAIHDLYTGYPFGCLADYLNPLTQRTLEIVALQLATMAGQQIALMTNIGKQKTAGLLGRQRVGKLAAARRQKVVEIYYTLERKDRSIQAIAKDIQKEYDREYGDPEKQGHAIHENTIKNYLSEIWAQRGIDKTRGFGSKKEDS